MKPRHIFASAVALATTVTAGALPAIAAAQTPAASDSAGNTANHRIGQVITSFDGTPIIVNFMPAADLAPEQRAPTILMGPGWAAPGYTKPDEKTSKMLGYIGVGPLRDAGYNVVTWDPRGFGGSGGEAHVNSPQFEVRDAQAVLDWLATQPEVELDAPGDPRLGMAGGSYGGNIQFLLAAADSRVDAIVPSITWNNNLRSLNKAGKYKLGWGSIMCGLGAVRGSIPGWFSPAGPQISDFSPWLQRSCDEGFWTNRVDPWVRPHLNANGPDRMLPNVRVPTMIVQGTADTLFTLDEARRNYEGIRANGVPVKMVWFCGGHGLCPTNSGPERIERLTLQWFDRHLRDVNVDTGPEFEYVDQHGVTRGGPGYPLASTGEMRSAPKSDWISLTRLDGSGTPISSIPTLLGADADFTPPTEETMVVGAPRVSFSYRGWAFQQDAHIFAQVVDVDTWKVIGSQATPIPIKLDGRTRTVEVDLELIAHHMAPGSRVRVQLFSRSNMYAPQNTTSHLTISNYIATLPTVNPGTIQQ